MITQTLIKGDNYSLIKSGEHSYFVFNGIFYEMKNKSTPVVCKPVDETVAVGYVSFDYENLEPLYLSDLPDWTVAEVNDTFVRVKIGVWAYDIVKGHLEQRCKANSYIVVKVLGKMICPD